MGACAAEVQEPEKAYPTSLSISVGLMVAVYMIPSLVGLSVAPLFVLWRDGFFIDIAASIGGWPLQVQRVANDSCAARVTSYSQVFFPADVPETSRESRSLCFIPVRAPQTALGFGGVMSACGLLLARMCTNSRLVYGMADVHNVRLVVHVCLVLSTVYHQ